MYEQILDKWLREAEQWKINIDFGVKDKQVEFEKRYDDFYLTLSSILFDILDEESENKEEILLKIARGLQIFSLDRTRDCFRGIDYYENMLVSAGIYYLTDYTANSFILASLFDYEDYDSEISLFLLSFFKKDLNHNNDYTKMLRNFFIENDERYLNDLIDEILKKVELTFLDSPEKYFLYKIAYVILCRLREDNLWLDLLSNSDLDKEVWKDYVRVKIARGSNVWGLFPSQKKALQNGILTREESFSLQMPTSAGKTMLTELIIFYFIKKNPGSKALFIAPYRALASEMKASFTQRLRRMGIKVKTAYGGNIETLAEKISIEEVDLLITTPEKFVAMENSLEAIYSTFSLVICDEGHLLDNEQRGVSYELMLSKLISKQVTKRKFIFLSAIIPNIDKINKWLGGNDNTILKSNYRPTELLFAFIEKINRKGYSLNVKSSVGEREDIKIENFLPLSNRGLSEDGNPTRYSFDTQKSLTIAVSLKALLNGNVAIFCPQKSKRSGVRGVAEELLKQTSFFGIPDKLKLSSDLYEFQSYLNSVFGTDFLLNKLVCYGFAYHHGSLPQLIREIIEDYLRNNIIKLVICTSTLAEGVNLPIKNLVIHSTKRQIKQGDIFVWRNIQIRDLKNIVGRSGRAGKEMSGLVIVPNANDYEIMQKVLNEQELEPVDGYLYEVLKEITGVIGRSLHLTNELLEEQEENFRKLIDSIDTSIIDLLGEEVSIEQLEDSIKTYIENTYSYTQANHNERKMLNQIFTLRLQRVRPYIESTEFGIIKKSGMTIRLYETLKKQMDLQNDLFSDTKDPISNEWLNYIISLILGLEQMQYIMNEFNERNQLSLDIQDIKEVIKLWISGKQYFEISQVLGLGLDELLDLFTSVLNYSVCNIASYIVRYIEIQSNEEQYVVSDAILNWSEFLLYGVSTNLELSLIEIGFTERIGVQFLRDYIRERGIEYFGDLNLLSILRGRKEEIISEMSTKQLNGIVKKYIMSVLN